MEEAFMLPVSYNGKELELQARMVISGYSHKFIVLINDTEVIFEKDDEGAYRGLIYDNDNPNARNIDIGLLKAAGAKIQEVFA